MKSTKPLPRAVLHEELLGMMRAQATEDVRDRLRRVIGAELGGHPIVTRALIEGCVIFQPDPNRPGVDIRSNFIKRVSAKPRPAKPKRRYRRSAAGRARQIAAMKKYWAAKRRARKSGKQ